MDKNNVLFVGNGIDLLDGYKTDYVSFLLNEKEEYKNLFIKGIEKNLLSKKLINNVSHDEKKVDLYEYIRMAYIDSSANELSNELRRYTIEDVVKSDEKKEISTEKSILKRLGLYNGFKNEIQLNIDSDFFNVKELKKEDVETAPIPNFWISYFIKCYLDGILSGENWIDLEGLICENSKKININDSSANIEHSIVDHKRKYYDEDHDIYDDFIIMKKKLCNYLYNAKKITGDLNSLHSDQLTKYGTILNFNYSSSDLLSTTIDNTNTSIDEFFIHGTINDKCDIVFGYDDGMLTNLATNDYEYENTELYKMSKTYQLLKLSLKHQNSKIERGVKIPEKKDINYIGILGHSISEADYNYFSTLCDFEKIIIEVFWYDYFIKDCNGKSVRKDNQISLMESLIAMIHEMEKQTKTKILHRMLIEQRIIFRKVIY